MKLVLGILCPFLVWAQSYQEVITSCDRSLQLKSAEHLKDAAWENYRAAQGKNLPSLDASLSAIKFNATPTMSFTLPALGSMTAPVATREHVEGEVLLSYPLFTGFAISASIDKARLNHEKASLEVSDAKRNLYLNATRLYSSITTANAIIEAQNEAKKAIDDSYKKAKGFYDNGLLPPSSLYAIEARKYEIETTLSETINMRQNALNRLSYLSGEHVDDATIPDSDLPTPEQSDLLRKALAEREDIGALSKALDIAQSDVDLAKSRYSPKIALMAALKRQGDSLAMNGDGYTNADKSYGGISASWNLFSGMSDYHTLQAAQSAKLAALTSLDDYRNRVGTEIENGFLALETLQKQLESSKMQVKSAEEYAKLIRGRFDNQLASADELSRAIADLAAAKAQKARFESDLFNQKASLWLQGGLSLYQTEVLKAN